MYSFLPSPTPLSDRATKNDDFFAASLMSCPLFAVVTCRYICYYQDCESGWTHIRNLKTVGSELYF